MGFDVNNLWNHFFNLPSAAGETGQEVAASHTKGALIQFTFLERPPREQCHAIF